MTPNHPDDAVRPFETGDLRPLPRSFYRPAAHLVAPRLLGHWLLRQTPDGLCGGPIVETEAYLVGDPASHAFKGRTARTASMYGPPGHAYVYLIYGFHSCFNAVCGPENTAEAVLVRAIEAGLGEEIMIAHRPVADRQQLTNGPGKLGAALNIDRSLDGLDLCQANAPLWIARHPEHKRFLMERGPIVTTTRVGITSAVDRPLRFSLEKSPFVSRRLRSS